MSYPYFDDKVKASFASPQTASTPKEAEAPVRQYKDDVIEGMRWMCRNAMRGAHIHDMSRLRDIGGYFNALQEAKANGVDVHDTEWYADHYLKERSHLDRRVPDDVNLIDVLECIAAAVMEGGSAPAEVSAETLAKAYANTFAMLKAAAKPVNPDKADGEA